MKPEKLNKWYENWFDSPYYSILYQNRDEQEAHLFIDHLLKKLQPRSNARMLDLACGKGRFSRYLAEQGFEVTGLDLSENSILFARQFESERLSFYTHDMRLPYRINYFDYIFSFFTSFGYFDTDREHLGTLKSIRAGMKDTGIFVLDFFNSVHVKNHLPAYEEKEADGIRFHIHKQAEGPYVVKNIRFEDGGRNLSFTERVRLYDCDALRDLCSQAGLKEVNCYGDYRLAPFDKESSPRMILVAQKA